MNKNLLQQGAFIPFLLRMYNNDMSKLATLSTNIDSELKRILTQHCKKNEEEVPLEKALRLIKK